jgi:hypothetical protein
VTTRVAIDTQVLLLLVVGLVDRNFIPSHKRLKQFDTDAFDLLLSVIGGAERIVATPNSLTEVSNLLSQGVSEPLRSALWQGFAVFIKSSIFELYFPTARAAHDQTFAQLGLADCVWLGCIETDTILLTDDLALYNEARSRGIAAYNFTYLRIEAGQLPS